MFSSEVALISKFGILTYCSVLQQICRLPLFLCFCAIDIFSSTNFPVAFPLFNFQMCFAVANLHLLELWITNLCFIVTSFPYEQIADSLCVGQRSPDGLEERVLLFLKMATGDVTPDLVRRLNSAIRSQLSAR